MKRSWIQFGLIAVGFACAPQVEAGPIDMGGFQIQVEEKQDGEIQTEQNNSEKWKWTTPVPKEVVPTPTFEDVEAEEMGGTAMQTETPVLQEEEWETFHEEETAGQQAEVWVYPQAGGSEEQETDPAPEIIQEGSSWQEEDGQETADKGQDGRSQEESIRQGEEDKEEEDMEIKNKSPKNKKNEDKKQEIRLVHGDFQRLSSRGSLAVWLEGEQEVCVLSCAVNHTECAYRWENGFLLPVEPPLKKGMNCLEISVLGCDGKVITMEPWYFSCGVGIQSL